MDDWTREEVEATVADYFEMLAAELRGEPVNKAGHNQNLRRFVRRSRGSIEFKHQNISAVLIELGCRYVDGYKPRGNYQDLLRDVIVERLDASEPLRRMLQAAADAPVEAPPNPADLLSILVPPPSRERSRAPAGGASHTRETNRPLLGIDYVGHEQRNRSLGSAGEELALRFEHRRLWTAGKKRLADRVEHVSLTRGDHLGYDIQSFETSGEDRLIEVKTTRSGSMMPFFVTRNEVRVSEARREEYYLYRLHRFDVDPRLFVLKGALSEVCELDGVQFEARVR
jgi:hypothetical protein